MRQRSAISSSSPYRSSWSRKRLPRQSTRGRTREATCGSAASSTSNRPSSASSEARSADAIPETRFAPERLCASRTRPPRISAVIAAVVVLPFVAESAAEPCGSRAASREIADGSSFQRSFPGSVVPPPVTRQPGERARGARRRREGGEWELNPHRGVEGNGPPSIKGSERVLPRPGEAPSPVPAYVAARRDGVGLSRMRHLRKERVLHMRHERPSNAGEARSSALWGKGSGGQSRGSALWGRGGRSSIALLALVVSVIVPAAGIAGEKLHAAVPSELIGSGAGQARRELRRHRPGRPESTATQRRRRCAPRRTAARSSGSSARSAAPRRRALGQGAAQARPASARQRDHAGRADVVVGRRLGRHDPEDAGMWRDVVTAEVALGSACVTCLVNLLGIKLDPSCIPSLGSKAPQAPAIAIFDSGHRRLEDGGLRLARRRPGELQPRSSPT